MFHLFAHSAYLIHGLTTVETKKLALCNRNKMNVPKRLSENLMVSKDQFTILEPRATKQVKKFPWLMLWSTFFRKMKKGLNRRI